MSSRPTAAILRSATAPHAVVENLSAHGGDRILRPLRAVGGGRFHFLAHRRRTGLRPVRDGAPSRHEPLRDRKRAVRRRAAPVVFQRPAMAAHGAFFAGEDPRRRKTLPPRAGGAREDGARRECRARTGEGANPFFPDGAALSNGAYRLLVTANGMSRASCGTLIPYRSARTPWEDAPGIALWAESCGVRQPLLPKPGEKGALRRRFTAGALLADRAGSFLGDALHRFARISGRVCGGCACVREGAPDAVIFGFEPVLLDTRDYAAHPAFARLGLCTSVRSGVLIVNHRAPRGNQSAQYLALACSGEAGFSSDFRQFPARGGAGEFRENTGWQNEPYIAARLPLPEGSACEIALALCVAGDADTARARRAGDAPESLRLCHGRRCRRGGAWRAARAPRPWEYLRALTFPQLCAEARPAGRDAGRALAARHFRRSPVMVFDGGKTARKPRPGASGGTHCSARAAWSTISCFHRARRGLLERAARGNRNGA